MGRPTQPLFGALEKGRDDINQMLDTFERWPETYHSNSDRGRAIADLIAGLVIIADSAAILTEGMDV